MQQNRWHLQAICFFFLCIVFSYSNSLTADWHFDDVQNILENEKLHLSSLNLESITQVFQAHPREEGRIFRPIAYLSFALNWYFGRDNVIGFHIVNILLHWGTALLLYLTTIQLLQTPLLMLKQRLASTNHLIALLAALLWALNPIQTQAVTYIVQRMAGLATFFFLASILCYLLGRRSEQGNKHLLWFLMTLVCFLLALGSKENSITLPAVLLLVEWIFFRSLNRLTRRHLLMGTGLLCLAGIAVYLLTNGNPIGSITGYDHRSFTLWQRLLTESRIMVFYLSLLFFPAPFRLSLDHDIALSTSLLQPPTTALSIAFLFGLTVWALWKHKSLPLIAFAVLFFLLNHLIESTIFPLEIIFEHRNYLPSLFLFLPLAAGLVDFYVSERLRTVPFARHGLASLAVLLICVLAAATYTRNAAWKTEQSLWEDSLAKAPGQSRPYINLAVTYQKMGRNDEAFALCQQSLSKDSPTPAKDRMRAYNNMGNITMDRGAYAEATNFYRQALQANENPPSRYFIHKALLADGQTNEAQEELAALMRDNPGDNELMTSMAIMLATRQEFTQALTMLRSTLDNAEGNRYLQGTALMCIGSILSRLGDHKGAEQHFREALSHAEPLIPLLCVTGNHLRQGNKTAAVAQLKELHKHFTTETLVHTVQSATRQNILFPLETKDFVDFIRFVLVSAPAADGRTL
jgi:tetratricopeptide (TPR) repeat protein